MCALDINLNSNYLTITGNFDDCTVSNEKRGEQHCSTLKIAEYATTAEPGKAELPVYSQLISLLQNGNFVLEDLTYDYDVTALDYYVQQFGWEDGTKKDETFYTSDEWYPKEIVSISSPVIMRGYRFCQVSIAAVQYNPTKNLIRVLKDINATFAIDLKNNDNPLIDTKSRPSSSFSNIVSEHVYGTVKDNVHETGSYLIIAPDECMSILQPLVEWKRKLGHEVTLTPLSEIGASPDNYDIKNYIQNAYLSWDIPPEFVVLVGDVTGNFIIPSFYVEGYMTEYDVSDHPYTLLEGDDYFPDVLLGRISIQSQMDLLTVISKILNYESILVEGSWYKSALMISCFNQETGMFTHYLTKANIGKKLLNFGFQGVDYFTYPLNTGVSNLINMIDQGHTLINFRGCGSPYYWASWWGYYFLELSDIPSLNNGLMLPMLTSITCGGADFAYAEEDICFGELWLTVGSPTNPKGAIGFIGPSEHDTRTRWNNCMDMGIYQGITQEELYGCGEMLLRGKMELYNNFPHNHDWGGSEDSDQFYFYVYGLLGDPGLQVWTDIPKNFSLICDDGISCNQNYIVVEVDVDDDCSDFIVALTQGDSLITKGITDANGNVTLYGDFTPGIYEITPSKYGYLPKTHELTVYSNESLQISNINFIDDPISGTIVEYSFDLLHFTPYNAEDISILISSNDGEVDVITDSIYVDYIQSQETFTFQYLYFSINHEWLNGNIANLKLEVNSTLGDQTYIIPVEIISPELVVSQFNVDNADSCLIQGQDDEVYIKLTNTGSTGTNFFNAFLMCTNGKATVSQDESNYLTIEPTGTGVNTIPFSVLPNQVITGENAQFELQIIQDDSLVQTIQLSVPIGVVSTTSPTFSEYGYYAIESSDTGNFEAPVYDWIELDPSLGGDGVPVEGNYETYDGAAYFMEPPFDICFFSHFCDKMTICTEGWIAMSEDVIYHRNKTIPSGCGPASMIAPFWDDLRDGNIYTWFDEVEHRFIIEWQDFRTVYDYYVFETFEVIIFDPEYYPTSNGNIEIMFQYKEVTNNDQDDNYATVGIENYQQTDGVLITYSNIYASTAHELQDETAILFTLHESPEIPLIEVSPQFFEFTLPQDTTETGYVTITNTSSTELSYWVETSHFSRDENLKGGKSVQNDFIICTSTFYVPVVPIDILCYLYHSSPDNEPVYGVSLDFPDGVYVNGAMDIETLLYNGQTGYGAEISWGFGNGTPIYTSGAHGFQINITIDESITGPIEIDWYLEGDGTGAEPHFKEGTLTLQPSANSYLWMDYPDGGETLVYSTTDTIRWITYGSIDNVSLYLTRDNCSHWETIVEDIPNTGQYAYTVDGMLSDYCLIKVKDADGYQSDISDGFFSINIFDITHPEVGEILEYNSLDTLCWNFSGIYSEVILEFSRDNGYTWDVINDALPNTGEYEYTVPGPPSNWCAFRIVAPDYSMSNRNHGVFTIVDSPVHWLEVETQYGTLSPGESALVPINVSTWDIEPGSYEAYVSVTSSIGQKINIPVTLEVSYGINHEPEEPLQSLIAHPNPFRNLTTISYNKTTSSLELAQIRIYNIKGQLVREFKIQNSKFKIDEVVWDGTDKYGNKVSSGLYYYQVKVGDEIIGTNKCLLMKD